MEMQVVPSAKSPEVELKREKKYLQNKEVF
jgi:hypothetical protein